MKTFIIGYSDRAGLGAAQIVCGLEVSALEQAQVMDKAKRLQQFPEGILRLEQYLIDQPIEAAIFISEETTKACQDRDAGRKKAEKEAQAKRAAQQKAEEDIITANKAFTAAQKKRNAAIAAVAVQKGILANKPGDEKVLAKIQELQAAADRANAEFQTVLELRNVIKNPKSEPQDVATAMKLIANPAMALELNTKAAADKAAAEAANAASNPA